MSKDSRKEGEKVRREVMGDVFVDRAFKQADDFDKEVQDMVCEHAWGNTWTRKGTLTRRERSLMTISMLTALRAEAELKGHVRGALNNGCTPDEIKEVLMHAAVYCGFPAALSAVKVAKEVIKEHTET